MNDELASLTTNLKEPIPPGSLKSTVMARIARDAEHQELSAAPAGEEASRPRERRLWLWAIAGIALVIGVSVYGQIQIGAPPDFTSPKIGRSLTLFPIEGPAALAVSLGLLLYLAGLFAPLSPRRRR